MIRSFLLLGFSLLLLGGLFFAFPTSSQAAQPQQTVTPPPDAWVFTMTNGALLAGGGEVSFMDQFGYRHSTIFTATYILDTPTSAWRKVGNTACDSFRPRVAQLNATKVIMAVGSTYVTGNFGQSYLTATRCTAVFDTVSETWQTYIINDDRTSSFLARLSDTKMLLAGGSMSQRCVGVGSQICTNQNPQNGEVFDLTAGKWTKTEHYQFCTDYEYGICIDTPEMQADGTLKVKTSRTGNPNQYYDPITNVWWKDTSINNIASRFYNPATQAHFFTTNLTERNGLLQNYGYLWQPEGVAFVALPQSITGTVPVYRFYNVQTTVHFYTSNEPEKAWLIANYANIYKYEGIAYYAYPASTRELVPVYRFYNPAKNLHHFTADETEKNILINQYGNVYKFEGISYYVYPSPIKK